MRSGGSRDDILRRRQSKHVASDLASELIDIVAGKRWRNEDFVEELLKLVRFQVETFSLLVLNHDNVSSGLCDESCISDRFFIHIEVY